MHIAVEEWHLEDSVVEAKKKKSDFSIYTEHSALCNVHNLCSHKYMPYITSLNSYETYYRPTTIISTHREVVCCNFEEHFHFPIVKYTFIFYIKSNAQYFCWFLRRITINIMRLMKLFTTFAASCSPFMNKMCWTRIWVSFVLSFFHILHFFSFCSDKRPECKTSFLIYCDDRLYSIRTK